MNVHINDIKDNQLTLDFLNNKWKIEINSAAYNHFVSIISWIRFQKHMYSISNMVIDRVGSNNTSLTLWLRGRLSVEWKFTHTHTLFVSYLLRRSTIWLVALLFNTRPILPILEALHKLANSRAYWCRSYKPSRQYPASVFVIAGLVPGYS